MLAGLAAAAVIVARVVRRAAPIMERDELLPDTPIYYVNDAAHMGHAYTTIAADTFARFHTWSAIQMQFYGPGPMSAA